MQTKKSKKHKNCWKKPGRKAAKTKVIPRLWCQKFCHHSKKWNKRNKTLPSRNQWSANRRAKSTKRKMMSSPRAAVSRSPMANSVTIINHQGSSNLWKSQPSRVKSLYKPILSPTNQKKVRKKIRQREATKNQSQVRLKLHVNPNERKKIPIKKWIDCRLFSRTPLKLSGCLNQALSNELLIINTA